MWFEALSHRPTLSLAALVRPSVRGPEEDSFLLRRQLSHGETRQNSLPPMTHPPTARAPLQPPAFQPQRPTPPHPGLDPSPPRPARLVTLSLAACIAACLLESFFSFFTAELTFLYLAVWLQPCRHVSLFTCLCYPRVPAGVSSSFTARQPVLLRPAFLPIFQSVP